jgi:uncharacterized protein (DUF1800 family)
MRWLIRLFVILLPLAAQAAPMGTDEARHLLNRAGFGASPSDVAEYARLERAQAVERLLAGTLSEARTPPPAWVGDAMVPPRELRAMAPDERKQFLAHEIRRGVELRSWWLQEMLATPSQLTERMTLFWHNHFVSSQQKVRYSQLMYRQNLLLRRHATGNFGTLLHEVSKDPAMVIYLDSATNRKGKPNENFAREVMELFTLGEGAYTEQDIREAARAFTGWSIDPATGAYKFRPFFHDRGTKTVLGRSGNFDGDAVLDLLLARHETAEHVVAKLWRELVSPEPDRGEVTRIARQFQQSNYEIKVALRGLLLSRAFWAEESRGALIKSPVDLVVGSLKQFEFAYGDAMPLAIATAQLGQNLFSPPNVKGWPGGEAWINSTTLLARKALAERLFRADEMPAMAMAAPGADAAKAAKPELRGAKGLARMGRAGRERFMRAMADIHFDAERWLADFGAHPSREEVARVVLARAPVNPIGEGLPPRELARQLALDPAYQLK